MSWLVATARQQVILKLIENEDVDPRQSHRYLRMANKTYLCLVYGNLKETKVLRHTSLATENSRSRFLVATSSFISMSAGLTRVRYQGFAMC